MPQKFYLTPGPSELYFTVPDHIQRALRENVCSISHRSKAYMQIHEHAVEQLRALLNIPESHHIVFTNSATEVWERLLQNCVEKESFHLVNGSFSQRFYEFAALLGKKGNLFQVPLGQGFEVKKVEVPAQAEIICTTHNETSTGVMMPLEDIYFFGEKYPDKLLVVDAVSSMPFPDFDYAKIDSLFFSVQKGMGLPAGLGVWVLSERCVEKASKLEEKGLSIGTYHTIPSLLEKAAKFQTPATPNVLGIYLLGKVSEDMLRRGIENIRTETQLKAAVGYQAIEDHPAFSPFVTEEKFRSKTVIVANLLKHTATDMLSYFEKSGIVIGKGYGSLKETQIRIANFPTHSKEIFFQVADLLEKL